jgi:hypothetical protein
MGRSAGLGRACRWAMRTAVGRRQHAGAGGSGGAARELGAVVTRTEEMGGEEEGLTGWHNGVGTRWLARDHEMGRRGVEPAWRQRSRAVASSLSGE